MEAAECLAGHTCPCHSMLPAQTKGTEVYHSPGPSSPAPGELLPADLSAEAVVRQRCTYYACAKK